ncbi:hypothetical protein SAMN05444162_5038 [Paenibacillaceae bacterium GAS479]|nr:hypothetical protein SAMN05444162_5038 [Paenibacillaceae bacterium GAS479]
MDRSFSSVIWTVIRGFKPVDNLQDRIEQHPQRNGLIRFFEQQRILDDAISPDFADDGFFMPFHDYHPFALSRTSMLQSMSASV